MQVSCESCGARYELDDSRFSGRGARITCPRCQHVFVVYREEKEEADISEAETATATEQKTYHVDDLDFRKVGIQAWKVKVKIGLVYDFSDYKTLAKYITDGRVTTADKISHDGKDWIEIGSIPDLAQHFVDVYIKAEHEQSGAGESEVSGVSEFDGEPLIFLAYSRLRLKGGEKSCICSANRAQERAEKSDAYSRSIESSKMGVDDELMKMAQNISADMASGMPWVQAHPGLWTFEQMRRKKRRPAVEVSPEAVAKAGALIQEGSSSRTKIYLGILFAVVAVALVVVYTQMGSSPPPTDAGKNQGQEQAKQAQESADESLEDPTQTPVIPLSTESSLDAFSNVSSDAFLDESGRAYTVDEVEQRDTIHFMKVPMTEEECPSNWYAIDNGKLRRRPMPLVLRKVGRSNP